MTRSKFEIDTNPALDHVRATKGDRTSSLKLWRNIATGKLGDAERYWLRKMACAVLEADTEPPKRRPDALMRAIGLAGKEDPHRRARRVIAYMSNAGCARESIEASLERQGLTAGVNDVRSLVDRELRKARKSAAD